METLLLGALLGSAIGATLGLLGGGGSILTVPALVYLLGQSPQMAVTTSLAIVGMNSTMGALAHRAHGTLNWRVALLFGGAGMAFAYLAAGFSKHLSPDALMIVFAALMLAVGLRLALSRGQDSRPQAEPTVWKIVLTGALVGILTGILGVGGGFLIVPALVMLVGLPFHQAVGTSLAIIAMNSFAGFLGHLDGLHLDLALIGVMLIAGLAGTVAGAKLAQRMKAQVLQRAFGLFVVGLALVLLYDNLMRLLPSL